MDGYLNDYNPNPSLNMYNYHANTRNPLGGYSVPQAGAPGNTSLYSNSLSQLSQRTDANLQRLKEKLVMIDPCYAYGIQHWHPDHRKPAEPEPQVYPAHACPKWESTNTMFSSRAEMDKQGWRRNKSEDTETTSGSGIPVCYLCSTLEEHQRHLAKRGLQMKAKKKVRPRVDFIAPLPTTRRKKEEELEEEKERLYKVTVRTSNKPNAATSANVFIKIRGSHGTLRRRQLTKKMSVQFAFGRGTSETFHIKGPTLGDLKYMTVEHDGIEQKHSWLLDEIEVKDMSGQKTWIFPCKQWFSLYVGDGILKRQLKAYEKEIEQVEYEITVHTGTKPRSGTSANVFITMFGKNGSSPKLKLRNKNEEDAFTKGKQDVFHNVVDDLGPIVRVRIEHDDTGDSPDWFLEKVAIEDLDDPNRCYIFPCGQWLSSQKDECLTYRELYPVTKRMALMHAKKIQKMKGHMTHQTDDGSDVEKNRYEVTVMTGSIRYAGTDANVFMEMMGKHGRTGELKLDDNKNNFEKGQTDIFKIEAAEIGNLKRIRIRHDNSGLGAGWFLEYIKIKKYFTKSEILHRLSQIEAQKEEEIAERKERGDKEGRRKSITAESDSEEEKRRKKKKGRESSSEDEYDRYGRKITKKKSKSKYKSSIIVYSSDEDKKRRKKRRSKYETDSDSDSDDKYREQRRKGKRRIEYNGIEQWITDSEDEEDGRSKKKHSSKHDIYDDKGRRKSKGHSSKYHEDSDSDGKYRRKKKTYIDSSDSDEYRKHKKKSGKKYYDDSSEEDRRKYKKKTRVRFHDDPESDSDDRRMKRDKKKKNRWESESESDDSSDDSKKKRRKKKKRHGKYESSSEESGTESEESLSNVRAYTTWKKDRVPYCDEYYFPCKKWLAKDEGDGQLERELKAESVVTYYRIPADKDDKKKDKRY